MNMQRILRDKLPAVAMLLPALALLVIFCFYPLVNVFQMSFQGTDIFGSPSGFVGLENYQTIFADPSFRSVLVRTIVYAVAVIIGRIVLGYLISALVTRQIQGSGVFRFLITSPISVSVAAASLGFSALLSPTGMINALLEAFHVQPINWLVDPAWAFPCVVAVTIWTGLAFTIVLISAAIEGVDPSVLEAARIDGASETRIHWEIIAPLIRPTLFYIAVTAGIEAFTSFAQINILTQGGPGNASTTIVYNIYTAAFGAGSANFGIAAALGIVLFAFVFVLTALEFRTMDKEAD